MLQIREVDIQVLNKVPGTNGARKKQPFVWPRR